MLSLILSLRKEVVPYFASARYGTGACSWQCSVVKPNNLILSDLIWLWARLPCVWAPTHAGRVDGRPPRRLRAAKEIRGAHHLQLLGSSGGRFTVDELGQRASFIGAQRGPACGAGSERGNGTVSAGALDAGGGDRVLTICSPQSVGSRCLGGYPTCGRRPGARRQRGCRPLGCYSAAACGAPPGHRGTCRAARRFETPSQPSTHKSLPQHFFQAAQRRRSFQRQPLRLENSQIWLLFWADAVESNAAASDRLEPVPAPLTLHYPH